MDIIAKTIKGKEFIYSNKTSILCTNEKPKADNSETLKELLKEKINYQEQLYILSRYGIDLY